jgi:hypothetical protein
MPVIGPRVHKITRNTGTQSKGHAKGGCLLLLLLLF